MKKKAVIFLLSLCMAVSMTACGGKGNENGTEVSTEDEAKEVVKGTLMEVDASKQVTKLCDYKGIDVTITGNYEVTDEQIQSVINNIITTTGLNMKEVERDTIQEGDTVKVDYVGSLDGVAFEGGTATNQMIKVGDGNGYIPGFTDGLVGAKKGETIEHDVTFPDPYTKNEDLSGKLTTFKFTIHEIYGEDEDFSIDDVTDEQIKEKLESVFGVKTKQELIDYVTSSMKQSMEGTKASAVAKQAQDYMLENCEVDVPKEYIEQCLDMYIESERKVLLEQGEDLDAYIKENFDKTLEEMKEEWRVDQEEGIKMELIGTLVAQKENITFTEEEFEAFVNRLLTSYNYADTTELYDYFGGGNVADGEERLRRVFLMNKGIEFVGNNANVTIDAQEEGIELLPESDTQVE